MASKKNRINTTVHVVDGHGRTHVLGPGDEVPGWAVEKISNPDVWVEPPDHPTGSGGGESSADSPPPRSGTGSGKDAWAKYAAAHQVEVDDGASRDDIITALQDAGVPVDPAGPADGQE